MMREPTVLFMILFCEKNKLTTFSLDFCHSCSDENLYNASTSPDKTLIFLKKSRANSDSQLRLGTANPSDWTSIPSSINLPTVRLVGWPLLWETACRVGCRALTWGCSIFYGSLYGCFRCMTRLWALTMGFADRCVDVHCSFRRSIMWLSTKRCSRWSLSEWRSSSGLALWDGFRQALRFEWYDYLWRATIRGAPDKKSWP